MNMNGLELIIEKIETDAAMSSDAIITAAEKKASDIIAEAQSDGAVAAADIIDAAKNECDAILRKAHSGGELLRKKKILSRKVEIIDGTVSKAVENFMRDDPAKYFNAMIKLAAKYVLKGKQDMVFSDKDIARIPADFEKNANDAVGSGADITVRGGGSFDGGFLLIGDDTVENCTLDALIGEAQTEIKDELCRILFG